MLRFTIRDGLATAVLLASVSPTFAAITTTGTVDFGVSNGQGAFGQVTVGSTSFGETPEDPRGSLTIDGGTQFEAESLGVGVGPFALAQATVTGPETRVVLFNGNTNLAVGQAGSGHLRIDGGAWVAAGNFNDSGSITIGPFPESQTIPGVATIEVAGPASLLTAGRQLLVQGGPTSLLSITDGAVVRAPETGDNRYGVHGTIELAGRGSELQTNRLILGSLGRFVQNPAVYGELIVRDEAFVRPLNFNGASAEINASSTLTLDGGTFSLPVFNLRGTIRGTGVIASGVDIDLGGQVVVGVDEELEIQGQVESAGEVRVDSGALSVFGSFVNQDLGEVTGRASFNNASVRFNRGMQNRGPLLLTDSELSIAFGNGEQSAQTNLLRAERSTIRLGTLLTNTGRLELIDSTLQLEQFQSGITNRIGQRVPAGMLLERSVIDALICCNAGLSNGGMIEVRSTGNEIRTRVNNEGQGELLVHPDASIEIAEAGFDRVTVGAGGSARFFGSVQQDEALAIAINDANRDEASIVARSQFPDLLQADFSVGGTLLVEAEGLTNVEADDEFLLVEADLLDGDFSEVDLPDLPGTLEFLPQLTDTTLSLLVIDTTEVLPGDFNADGMVNAVDYTLWRDGALPGGSRWIDHQIWQQNFGRTLSPPASAVPEPAACLLAIVAMAAGGRLTRQHPR
ncbi:MAG: hypothetical protein AAF266_01210 [Planctomycetota bacterium]